MFLHSKSPFPSWANYLVGLAFLLGAVFFCSGLISWIAANWYGFSDNEKRYGVQALFILSLGISLLYHRSLDAHHPSLPSQVALFISAVSIGGLFALIGQIYQTGADNWQLFTLWAVFQSMILLASPNLANAELFWVTTITAIVLWLKTNHAWETTILLYILIAISLFSVFMTELSKNFFKDQHWRVLIRCSALLLFISMLLLEFTSSSSTHIWHSLLSITIALSLSWFYSHKIVDVIIVSLNILLLILIVTTESAHFLIKFFGNNAVAFFIIGIIELAIGLQLVLFFSRLFIRSKQNPSTPNFIKKLSKTASRPLTSFPIHWALQAILFIIISIAALSFAYVNVSLWASKSKMIGLLINSCQGIAFCIASWYLYRHSLKKPSFEKYSSRQTVTQAFAIIGLFIILSSELFVRNLSWHLYLALLLSVTMFWQIPLFLTRTFCTFIILNCIFLCITPSLKFTLYDIDTPNLLSGHYIFLVFISILLITYQLIKKPSEVLWPILWGSLLFIVINIPSSSSTSLLYQAPFEASQDTYSLSIWTQMTGGLYTHFSWTHSIFYLWACSPAIVGLILSKNLTFLKRMIIALVLLCLGSMWIYYPSLLLSIDLLLCIHRLKHRGLFALTLSIVLTLLGFLYYSLEVSLLAKAYFLLITGLLLLIVSWLTFHRQNTLSRFAPSFHLPNKRFSILIGTTLVSTLGFANYLVYHYENILQNGQNIVLKLAPVDPRSLMQGDYMELNFEELNKASQEALKYGGRYLPIEGNILLSADEKGIAHFCGLNQIRTTQCPLSIKVNFLGHGARLVGSQHYFFPEGNREYFAQARYAEFRQGKDGTLLIKQLLDKDLHPLSKAPPITD